MQPERCTADAGPLSRLHYVIHSSVGGHTTPREVVVVSIRCSASAPAMTAQMANSTRFRPSGMLPNEAKMSCGRGLDVCCEAVRSSPAGVESLITWSAQQHCPERTIDVGFSTVCNVAIEKLSSSDDCCTRQGHYRCLGRARRLVGLPGRTAGWRGAWVYDVGYLGDW